MFEQGRGDRYDAGYEARAAAGKNVHGEADFVMGFAPSSVLDAGCGTGRVGREVARRGVAVVGVDLDQEYLETARRKAPDLEWIHADISAVDLGRAFDVVLMAGNVVNFVAPDRRRAAVHNLSRHLAADGVLVAGHSIHPGGCSPADLDSWCAEAGLTLVDRFATWQRGAFQPGSDYSLSVHRRGGKGMEPGAGG